MHSTALSLEGKLALRAYVHMYGILQEDRRPVLCHILPGCAYLAAALPGQSVLPEAPAQQEDVGPPHRQEGAVAGPRVENLWTTHESHST